MVMTILTVVALNSINFMDTGKNSTYPETFSIAKNPTYSHLTRTHSTNPAAGNNPAYIHPNSTIGINSTNSATGNNPVYIHPNSTTGINSTNSATGNNPVYIHPNSTTGINSTNSATSPRNNPAYCEPYTFSK